MFFIPYGTAEKTNRQLFPYINVLLVLANIVVFGFELLALASGGEAGYNHFFERFAFVPASLDQSFFQVTLITAMFVHGGLLHIIGNMMYLLPFGDNVEDRLGHVRYLLFYFICGIAASLIFAAFNMHSAVPLVGASGAIAGVLGGYLALHSSGSTVKGFLFIIILFIRIQLPAIVFIGYWFVMQVFSTVASLGASGAAQSGGIAFLAHVGGFITGIVLAPLLARDSAPSPQTRSYN